MAKSVLILPELKRPKNPGTYTRLTCLSGDNKGKNYYLMEKRVVIGRGENTDIQILDGKASREHAEIIRFGDKYVITDLGSQNGIFVNDLKVNQHTLKENDRLVVGKTVFKFTTLIVEEKKEGEEKKEKSDESGDVQESEEAAKKKKLRVLLILGAVLAFVLMGEDNSANKNAKRLKVSTSLDISDEFSKKAARQQYEENRELQEKLNNIFKRGLREYREGNYFRAISEFNLALILSPNNGRASFYLQKTKDALNKEIESFFKGASRDLASLKYDNAIIKYCSIIRLLQNYPEDERYKAAAENIIEVEKKLGIEEGETQCIEK